ncbi:hypothetical protein HaLaN_05512 [Haematococcus lacustris]|uniref:Uncharacterized protein n=1 Tax=Haematococcus lacustris TaxID=44745 RepID=A0A699YTW4_HAELA|nr:hypothetical protein HaLaN_05512 [Haematococcus lacustris]
MTCANPTYRLSMVVPAGVAAASCSSCGWMAVDQRAHPHGVNSVPHLVSLSGTRSQPTLQWDFRCCR